MIVVGVCDFGYLNNFRHNTVLPRLEPPQIAQYIQSRWCIWQFCVKAKKIKRVENGDGLNKKWYILGSKILYVFQWSML